MKSIRKCIRKSEETDSEDFWRRQTQLLCSSADIYEIDMDTEDTVTVYIRNWEALMKSIRLHGESGSFEVDERERWAYTIYITDSHYGDFLSAKEVELIYDYADDNYASTLDMVGAYLAGKYHDAISEGVAQCGLIGCIQFERN